MPGADVVFTWSYQACAISVFQENAATGLLARVGQTASTGCNMSSLAANRSGTFLVVGRGLDRTIEAFRVDRATGSVSSTGARSLGTFPNAVAVDPTSRFAYAVVNNSVHAFQIDASSGALVPSPVASAPLPANARPVSVVVDPLGRFLYVANRGSDDISMFAIDALTGSLSALSVTPALSGGGSLLNFGAAASPNGQFLYTATSQGQIGTFAIDRAGGRLTSAGTASAGTGLLAITFDPLGRFAYGIAGGGDVTVLRTDPGTGAVTRVGVASTSLPSFSMAVPGSGGRLYMVIGANEIFAFDIDGATGNLSAAPSTPTTESADLTTAAR